MIFVSNNDIDVFFVCDERQRERKSWVFLDIGRKCVSESWMRREILCWEFSTKDGVAGHFVTLELGIY